MPIFIATLDATLSSIVRSRAALELANLALRHQIGVLQRSARKRPKLTPLDRLLWAWLFPGKPGAETPHLPSQGPLGTERQGCSPSAPPAQRANRHLKHGDQYEVHHAIDWAPP